MTNAIIFRIENREIIVARTFTPPVTVPFAALTQPDLVQGSWERELLTAGIVLTIGTPKKRTITARGMKLIKRIRKRSTGRQGE